MFRREFAAPSKTSKGSSSKSPRGPANYREQQRGSISRWGRAVGPLIGDELRNFARHISLWTLRGSIAGLVSVFSWRPRRLCFVCRIFLTEREIYRKMISLVKIISLFRNDTDEWQESGNFWDSLRELQVFFFQRFNRKLSSSFVH